MEGCYSYLAIHFIAISTYEIFICNDSEYHTVYMYIGLVKNDYWGALRSKWKFNLILELLSQGTA